MPSDTSKPSGKPYLDDRYRLHQILLGHETSRHAGHGGAFLTAHRRNMETLTAANRVALEGAQAVARRHMEIMQQAMSGLSESLKSLASAEAPQQKAAKQAEILKKAYQQAVSNMKELSDLIQQSNTEALGLLNKRFTEAMDEIKTIVEKTGQQQKPAGG